MKLELEIYGKIIDVEFNFTNGVAQLSHDGYVYRAEASEPEPGLFVIILNNRVYRCVVEKSPNGGNEVTVNGKRVPAAARDKKHLRGNAGASGGGRVLLSSPMPGKVVRLLLSAGEELAAHQGVLIVEAMKMQNEVQSPRAGKVVEICVSEGQTVDAGETLAIID